SKDIGESLSRACSCYIALLDYLEVEKVHVLAISAGGPSGIYLAAHYPERVKTLTLQSAVTKEWHTPEETIYKVARVLFRPYMEKITWKLTSSMSNGFPEVMFKQMSASLSTLSNEEISARMRDEDIVEVRRMNNRQRSRYGFLMDLMQTNVITKADLQRISVPTLIMHSKCDGAVPLAHAYDAHQHISGSRLCLLDVWGHLIWLGKGSRDVPEIMTDFLKQYEMMNYQRASSSLES